MVSDSLCEHVTLFFCGGIDLPRSENGIGRDHVVGCHHVGRTTQHCARVPIFGRDAITRNPSTASGREEQPNLTFNQQVKFLTGFPCCDDAKGCAQSQCGKRQRHHDLCWSLVSTICHSHTGIVVLTLRIPGSCIAQRVHGNESVHLDPQGRADGR